MGNRYNVRDKSKDSEIYEFIKILAKSIEKYGLIHQITVCKKGKNEYDLICGQLRLAAYEMLGRKTIPARIKKISDPLDKIVESFLENVDRREMNGAQIAQAIGRIYEKCDRDILKVIELVSRSKDWVNKYIKINDRLDPTLKDELIRGWDKIGPEPLVAVISNFSPNNQKEALDCTKGLPQKTRAEIIRKSKEDLSKLQIMKMKELIKRFVSKVITDRFEYLRNDLIRFYGQLKDLFSDFLQNLHTTVEHYPIFKILFKDIQFKHDFKYFRRDWHEFFEKFNPDIFFDLSSRFFISDLYGLVNILLEDFLMNSSEYNEELKEIIFDGLIEIVREDIFNYNILQSLLLIKRDPKKLINEYLPDILEKVEDKEISASHRVDLFEVFSDIYFRNHLNSLNNILLDDQEELMIKERILNKLIDKKRDSPEYNYFENTIILIYESEGNNTLRKQSRQILLKNGKLCGNVNCISLINLDKNVKEIPFCYNCNKTFCDNCIKKGNYLLECNCGNLICIDCDNHYKVIDIKHKDDSLCFFCLDEGKYLDNDIICKKCLDNIISCTRCGKKVCQSHRDRLDHRYHCQECSTLNQIAGEGHGDEDYEDDDYEWEDEVEEEDYYDNETYNYEDDFKINDYLTLKLRDDGATVIFVNGEEFNQCIYLLLNISIDETQSLDDIESIDEAEEKLDHVLEPFEGRVEKIDPETEYWGHCSNIQAWAENNYDTRLIHRNLAFPLLKRLTEVGDPIAQKVFKEEVAKRLECGYFNVVIFLINQGYLNYLNNEELKTLFENPESNIYKNLLIALMGDNKKAKSSALNILNRISKIKYKFLLNDDG